jgi:peptide/nickel transport system permease protein
MKPVLLWTDLAGFVLLAAVLLYARAVMRTPHLAATWRQAFRRPAGCAAATVLVLFGIVGLADSLHYRERLPAAAGQEQAWSPETLSLLDAALAPLRARRETTYSAPLAVNGYEKAAVLVGPEQYERRFPRLAHAGEGLADPERDRGGDILLRTALGILGGAALSLAAWLAVAWRIALPPHGVRGKGGEEGGQSGVPPALVDLLHARTSYPLRAILLTLTAFFLLAGPILVLATHYHVFGTDRVGNDLLYRVLKSIRTALIIGTMTTLVTLPLSVGLGMLAGYLRGWVDEAVQYVVTVINSIPYVLLIAAAVLLLTVFIDANPDIFHTSAERTDARLFFLCMILGLTTWTDLARLVRGEVLKLRELEFVQAAQAFGVRPLRIMAAHLLPNLMHIILINIVIRFSELVLAEATLSYVGVGVDPAMASFGTLINTARLELGRDPVIWWTLASAFAFMFALVLAANFFADAVRDAFDPRSARK